MPTRSLTVQFSHVEVVKILLPALELLLVRTHDLVNGTRDEPPYARWIRETGYSLIASLRRELHDVPWGQRLLTLTVDSDGLGLLAAASGALRRHVREHGDAALGTLLDEARQRIWMTAPLDMELTWWVARSALTEELLPLLRSIRSRSPDPNEAQHAERLLQVTFARLRAQNGDAVRLQTPLADLARLAQWTSRTTEPLRLGGLLQQLVDPLVLERHVTAKRRHESQHNDRTWSESRGADGRGSGQNTSSSANAGQRQERAATETRAQADTPPRGTPAPVLRRVAAAVIDLFVFAVVTQVIGIAGSLVFVGETPGVIVLAPELYDRLVGFVSWAVPLTTTYLYWIYPVGRWGWRRGKRAVSLFVVNTHGTPPGQAKAVGRALLAVLLGWILFLPWWQVPFRADGRGMHDMATDVWVIQDPLA